MHIPPIIPKSSLRIPSRELLHIRHNFSRSTVIIIIIIIIIINNNNNFIKVHINGTQDFSYTIFG